MKSIHWVPRNHNGNVLQAAVMKNTCKSNIIRFHFYSGSLPPHFTATFVF